MMTQLKYFLCIIFIHQIFSIAYADNTVFITAPENYISDFPNEQLSIQGLIQKMVYEDVSIPGNAGMDILVSRTHVRDYYYLNIPYISVSIAYADPKPVFNSSCLGEYQRLNVGDSGQPFNVVGYDVDSEIPNSAIAIFGNHFLLKCEGSSPVLNGPDGRKYKFVVTKSKSDQYYNETSWKLSTIEDRFGNIITYEYENTPIRSGYPPSKRLKSITRNDGQIVNFLYASVHNSRIPNGELEEIAEIQYSGKKIVYDYELGRLSSVTDPEGRKTSFTYSQNSAPVGYQIHTITTPDNLKVEYHYKAAGTPTFISGRFTEEHSGPSATLGWKKITGPGIQEKYFNYTTTFGDPGHAKTLIFQMDYKDNLDLTTEYTFKTRRNHTSSGQVVSIKRFEGEFTQGGLGYRTQYDEHKLIMEQSINWVERNNNEFGCPISARYITDSYSVLDCGRHVVSKRELKVRNEDAFDTYVINHTSFDIYDQPEVSMDYFSGAGVNVRSRSIKNEYLHDVENWVLNLPTKQYISYSNVFDNPSRETVYNDQLLPFQEKIYDRVNKTHYYHSDGNLLKTSYEGSAKYEKFEDYYRGKPRKITRPCAIANDCSNVNGSTINTAIQLFEINSDGRVSSEIDFNGNKISYLYNLIGWPTKIDYNDPKWDDVNISYSTVTELEDGISGSEVQVGYIKETRQQGDSLSDVYYDALKRKVFSRELDLRNLNAVKYQIFKYDSRDRQILSSFPHNEPNNRMGVDTEYDALGRIIAKTRSSDGSVKTHTYYSGNKIAVTDGENNTITTSYLAYGTPEQDKPTFIDAPNSDDITIDHNIFGNITNIRQGNLTEKRLYDAYQQLCKLIRPETGTTAFGYNYQGQPIWQAQGTNGSATSCDAAVVPASHKVLLSYDNLGQLRSEDFPDATPDNAYKYDANGNVISLVSGPVRWSYLYNSINGVEKETLSLDGKKFELDWEYDALGTVSSLKYPSGTLVDFAPNALGQPTKAGSYATNVSYHANGQIKQFTYGNGIVRHVALDSTGRIDLLQDSKSGVLKTSLDPSYDYNDNLAGLIDGVDAANNISNLAYDGLDRLLSADGRWGQGSYNYDGLGNITSRSISGATINYSYDSLNRLNKLSGAYGYDYQYDSRGNVTHNGRYGLTFNRANQVSEAKVISYVYDGHNRRVKQAKQEGSNYSVYSNAGQLLHRFAADGTMTDSIYLDKQLIAEIEVAGVPIPPSKPSIEINVSQHRSGSECPRLMVCATNTVTSLSVSWTSENATYCSGNVVRAPDPLKQGPVAISGTTGRLSFPALGILYTINLTCVGAGGQSTAQRSFSELDKPDEM